MLGCDGSSCSKVTPCSFDFCTACAILSLLFRRSSSEKLRNVPWSGCQMRPGAVSRSCAGAQESLSRSLATQRWYPSRLTEPRSAASARAWQIAMLPGLPSGVFSADHAWGGTHGSRVLPSFLLFRMTYAVDLLTCLYEHQYLLLEISVCIQVLTQDMFCTTARLGLELIVRRYM